MIMSAFYTNTITTRLLSDLHLVPSDLRCLVCALLVRESDALRRFARERIELPPSSRHGLCALWRWSTAHIGPRLFLTSLMNSQWLSSFMRQL